MVFSTVEQPTDAYWLGMLQGDAHIDNRKEQIRLKLQRADKAHVSAFQSYAGTNHIGVDRCPKDVDGQDRVYTTLREGKAASRFNQFVSATGLPDINTLLMRHWLRGIWDADGWLSIYDNTSDGSPPVTEWGFSNGERELVVAIRDHLSDELDVRGNKVTNSSGSTAFHVRHASPSALRSIYAYFYSDAEVWLDRKKSKFEQALELRS